MMFFLLVFGRSVRVWFRLSSRCAALFSCAAFSSSFFFLLHVVLPFFPFLRRKISDCITDAPRTSLNRIVLSLRTPFFRKFPRILFGPFPRTYSFSTSWTPGVLGASLPCCFLVFLDFSNLLIFSRSFYDCPALGCCHHGDLARPRLPELDLSPDGSLALSPRFMLFSSTVVFSPGWGSHPIFAKTSRARVSLPVSFSSESDGVALHMVFFFPSWTVGVPGDLQATP